MTTLMLIFLNAWFLTIISRINLFTGINNSGKTTLLEAFYLLCRQNDFLIDEFENAIHTELRAMFAGFIDELSTLFNTQVFLTSHSKECIDAFVKNIHLEN